MSKKWTYDACLVEAKQYKSISEFQKKSKGAYMASYRNGWIREYDWFPLKRRKWTYDDCLTEAKKYKSIAEFKRNSSGAYQSAYRNGWLNEYSWLVSEKVKWTYTACYNEAQKYKTRFDFQKGSYSAYVSAWKHGWLDEYVWFENRAISNKLIYIIYCYLDDENNSVYVGLTKDLKRRHKQHCNGFKKDEKIRYDIVYQHFTFWGKEIPAPQILETNLSSEDAQIYEYLYVEDFKNKGFNVLNISKTGSLGGLGKWTESRCFNEAKKYNSKWDFGKNSASAYYAALRNGWMKNYVWFKRPVRRNNFKWTYEKCYDSARMYATKIDFKKMIEMHTRPR